MLPTTTATLLLWAPPLGSEEMCGEERIFLLSLEMIWIHFYWPHCTTLYLQFSNLEISCLPEGGPLPVGGDDEGGRDGARVRRALPAQVHTWSSPRDGYKRWYCRLYDSRPSLQSVEMHKYHFLSMMQSCLGPLFMAIGLNTWRANRMWCSYNAELQFATLFKTWALPFKYIM